MGTKNNTKWLPTTSQQLLKVRIFFGKSVEKKHLYRHEKNYYYFWKSNILVINLIADSKNVIKVSKNMNL